MLMKSTANSLINLKNFKIFVQFVLTRAAVAYAVVFLMSHVIIDYDKIKFGLGLRQLNFMMPNSYQELLEVENLHQQAKIERFQKYIDFYAKVVELLPQKAEAYGMLGFCYYYLGDVKSALQAFEEAHRVNPKFFWFSYNLGAIYFNLKDYPKAQEYFKQAVGNDINLSYSYILNSREIYMPILKTFEKPEKEAESRLIQAYYFCQEQIKLLDLKINSKPAKLPAQLVVRIF